MAGAGSSAERGERAPARHCEVPGCGWATRHGKPWCSRHAHKASPYVLALVIPDKGPGECACGAALPSGVHRYCSKACKDCASRRRRGTHR